MEAPPKLTRQGATSIIYGYFYNSALEGEAGPDRVRKGRGQVQQFTLDSFIGSSSTWQWEMGCLSNSLGTLSGSDPCGSCRPSACQGHISSGASSSCSTSDSTIGLCSTSAGRAYHQAAAGCTTSATTTVQASKDERRCSCPYDGQRNDYDEHDVHEWG